MNLSEVKSYDLEELVADARACLNSKGMKFVFDSLHEEYMQKLLNAEVGDLTANSAHASMKVLEDVKSGFQRILTEDNIRKRKHR